MASACIVVLAFVAATFRFTTVDVTVVSNQASATVAFTLTLDGRTIGSGTLDPAGKVLFSIPLTWWFVDCVPHTLSADGSAGEPFPGGSSQNLTVCAGTSYASALFV